MENSWFWKMCRIANVGTMIRTADAAGFDGVFLSDKSADIYNMKVLRSMQGESLSFASLSDVNFLYSYSS